MNSESSPSSPAASSIPSQSPPPQNPTGLYRHSSLLQHLDLLPLPAPVRPSSPSDRSDVRETGPQCHTSKMNTSMQDIERAVALSLSPAAHDMRELRKELIERAQKSKVKMTAAKRKRLAKFEHMLFTKLEDAKKEEPDEAVLMAIEAIFSEFSKEFATQEEQREQLRSRRDAIEEVLREPQQILSRLHTDPDVSEVTKAAKEGFRLIGRAVAELEESIPDVSGYFRYLDIWRVCLQQIVSTAVMIRFIDDDMLASVNEVKAMIAGEGGKEVMLPLEEYLVGVCNMMSELARLCMNRVTMGDFDLPRRCAAFASAVFGAFKMLNFRNDFLRKRYDGMKYDVKRIEEIIYDLSIRGLLTDDKNHRKAMKKTEGNHADDSLVAVDQ